MHIIIDAKIIRQPKCMHATRLKYNSFFFFFIDVRHDGGIIFNLKQPMHSSNSDTRAREGVAQYEHPRDRPLTSAIIYRVALAMLWQLTKQGTTLDGLLGTVSCI